MGQYAIGGGAALFGSVLEGESGIDGGSVPCLDKFVATTEFNLCERADGRACKVYRRSLE